VSLRASVIRFFPNPALLSCACSQAPAPLSLIKAPDIGSGLREESRTSLAGGGSQGTGAERTRDGSSARAPEFPFEGVAGVPGLLFPFGLVRIRVTVLTAR
jgi:hypothetical protein